MTPTPATRAGLVLTLGVVSLSWAAVLIRLTVSPAVTVAAWRMTLAAALLVPLWGVRRARLSRRGLGLALVAGGFLALHFALWTESLRLTTVASSVALVTTNPLFVGLLSSLFLGERPSRALWQGIGLSVAGGLLIGWGDFALGGTALLGDVLALLGAVASSAYLLVGRRARDEGPLVPYATVAYGIAAALLLAGASGGGDPLPLPTEWLWIALLALGPQLLGHTSVNWALRRFPASAVAVAILGEPVGATLWAYLVFGEVPGIPQGIGIVLVLLGIVRALRGVRL
ncbi:MAG TPA: DMT family transporter [Candidatus Bipolaricaulis anaerobius]|nr:DMT family transporter [Candidatus Bipolaricaulis anaerobius]